VDIKDLLPHLDEIRNNPNYPGTRGELTDWLCDEIGQEIQLLNVGDGYCNDVLLTCLCYIREKESMCYGG